MRRCAPFLATAALLLACRSAPAPGGDKPAPSVQVPAVPVPRPPRVETLPAAGGQKPTALVVMLHGVGADAESFHELARPLAAGLGPTEFVTPDGFHPYEQGNSGRQWFSRLGLTDANRPARVRVAGEEVSRWIDTELIRRNLAPSQVAIVGFSQGAMVAAWLAVHRSPSPRAVVMFSGRVADDAAPVAGTTRCPVLLLHGTDDTVIPPSVVAPGVRTLEAWGATVTSHVLDGLAHSVDAREIAEARAFLSEALTPR